MLIFSKDLHGSWQKFTGHHSALYSRSDERDNSKYLNVDWAVRYWLDKGLTRDKLVLGLPSYGRSFTLTASMDNKIGSNAKSAGDAGKVIIRIILYAIIKLENY